MRAKVIITVDAHTEIEKIQHPFMINAQQMRNRKYIFPYIRHLTHPVNAERLKAFPLRLGTRQGCSLSLLFFDIVWENLAKAVSQQKEIKGIQIGKEEVKLCVLPDNITLYVENPHDITPKNSVRANK
jgi:hypothetical protein